MDLIATTLGLQVREQEEAVLWRKLLKRVQVLGLPSLEAYYQILTSGCHSITGEAEWRELIDLLTVNESYFFRDQGQFSLLKKHVLPELIKCKQGTGSPVIRVWSAGCSTGEEAYSLAILLKELIPAERAWQILVLGTDVNASALEQAKRGVYSNWSFRSVDPQIREKYFRPCRQGWEIDYSIRSMVTFQFGNLVQDNYPNAQSEIHSLDLILCRNVFIYFSREAVAAVLDRFYRVLSPGGYLITGHAELYGQNLGQFQVEPFPESVLYRRDPIDLSHLDRKSTLQNPSPFLVAPVSSQSDQTTAIVAEPVEELMTLMARKAYLEVIRKAKQVIVQEPQHLTAYCLMAEAYANLGDHLNATQICQQVLQTAPFAIEPFYLLAQIAQEQEDLEAAKNLLKRVIYLAPTSVYAYFELGCLYEQQGNLTKARRSWRSALELLKPVSHPIAHQMSQQIGVSLCTRLTVAELQAATEQKLNRPALN
ncbi:MAG: protein-glutamate O-methyltransferase CheR [Elainellaceae cyanobacterium]